MKAAQLQRKIRVGFLTVAAVVACECLAILGAALTLHDGARVIDVSGLARMHSQRIAFLAAAAHTGVAPRDWRSEVEDSIAGIAAADGEATRSPLLAKVLAAPEQAALERLIARYVDAARVLERSPSDGRAWATVITLRPIVLAHLRNVVKRRTRRIDAWNDVLTGAVAAGLVFDAALLFSFWFHLIVPAQRALVRDIAVIDAERVQMRSIFNENPDAIAVYDVDNRLVSSNAARCALFGRSADEMIGLPLAEFIEPDRLAEMEHDFARARAGAFTVKEMMIRDREGVPIPVDVNIFPLVVDGDVCGTIVASRDIRELRAAKTRSDELAGRLAALHEISSAHVGDWREQVSRALALVAAQLDFEYGTIGEIDADGRHVTLLMSTGDPVGWPAGRSVPIETTLTPQIVRSAAVWTIDDVETTPWRDYNARNGTAWRSLAAMAIRIGGAVSGTLALTSTNVRRVPLHAADRDFIKVVAVLLGSLIDRGRQTDLLESLAHTDGLTGLPNRAAIVAHLNRLVAACAQTGESFAIHFIDLDHFKTINDTAGHDVGDAVLREVGHRLRQSLREDDIVGRLAGDEFVVLQPGGSMQDGACELAERIVTMVTAPIVVGGADFELGCSVGISIYPHDGVDGATLMRRADEAMYRSKAGRRSCPAFAAV